MDSDSSHEEQKPSPASDSEDFAYSTPELPDTYYTPEEDEVQEDSDLVVWGESIPEEEDGKDEDEDVPMRLLKNFTIYEMTSRRRLVRFDRYLCSDKSIKFGASGCVEPYIEPDDDGTDTSDSSEDEEHPVQRISLSEIKEINVHAVSTEKRFSIDP